MIGNGTFGLIRKVRRKSDGKLFARKELNFERMNERDRKHIVSEVNILRTLRHENVVRYEERYVDTENGILYIVMELCEGGDLGSVIKKCRRTKTHLPEETVWGFFAQMTAALEACHYRSTTPASDGIRTMQAILHRDLKPENVFLDADQNVKLGDFGLSKQVAAQAFANTYVGTPYYMSPELATGQPYDIKSDVWALGCIVFELCALCPPFDASNQAELTRKIKQGAVPALPRPYSRELQEAVHAMLQLDHRRRPTTRQLLQIRQIKMACRTHDIALLHKQVRLDKERLVAQTQALDARRADLVVREQKLASRMQEMQQMSDMPAMTKALDERALLLNQRELELCRREEACSAQQDAMRQWTHEKEMLQETIARLHRELDEKNAILASALPDTSLNSSRTRLRKATPKSEELLRSRIADGALSLHSPVPGKQSTVTDDEWVDDDEPRAPATTLHNARLRRAELSYMSDCSMKDASCMWREPLPWRTRATDSPKTCNEKRTSLPETAQEAQEAPSIPTSRTMPVNLDNLPQEPQWLLLDEDERPSPFLKRVHRIPLEALKGDAHVEESDKCSPLVPGTLKAPRSRLQEASNDQENVPNPRLRAFADQRRRRSSLLRPVDARPAHIGIPRLESVRTRAHGIPSSPSARSLRPFAAQRAQ